MKHVLNTDKALAPDWSKFNAQGSYPISELVALSCNLAPDKVHLATSAVRATYEYRVAETKKAVENGELTPARTKPPNECH